MCRSETLHLASVRYRPRGWPALRRAALSRGYRTILRLPNHPATWRTIVCLSHHPAVTNPSYDLVHHPVTCTHHSTATASSCGYRTTLRLPHRNAPSVVRHSKNCTSNDSKGSILMWCGRKPCKFVGSTNHFRKASKLQITITTPSSLDDQRSKTPFKKTYSSQKCKTVRLKTQENSI